MTCCATSTTPATAWTAGCPSRSTPGSRTTPSRRSPRPASCGGWWTGPTCSSRSPPPRPDCRPSPQCLAEGISINVTLIFSRQRYAEVMDAFLDGVEQARAAGHDLTRLASVASFFVSRVDTEIDQRLDAIGSVEAKALRGTAAIANARLAFQRYDGGLHLRPLARPRPSRGPTTAPLWASTGVKDPAYTDTRYVLDLVTDGVVNTMPEATLRAVADHGVVRGDTIRRGYDDAAAVMAALADVGIDYDDVVDKLERDGLTKFQASWAALAETLQQQARGRDSAAAKERTIPHERSTHVRHRRRRPGRRQGRRGAARRGLRRTHRPARGGAAPALRAATAVQGIPAGQRRAATPSSCTRPDWYADHQVELRLDTAGHRDRPPRPRDRDRRRRAGCATTSCCWPPAPRPRRLPVPGADLDGVHYLRSLDDSDHLKAALRPGARVVIIGGGWIGLETAAAARAAGAEVTVLEQRRAAAAARPRTPRWRRCSPTCTAITASTCAAGSPSTAIRPAANDPSTAGAVLLADGTELAADVDRRRHRGHPERRAGPILRAERRQRHPRRRSTCAPPTTTSSPPATSPTPTTRCWAGSSASSTGPTRCTSRPSPPRPCSARPPAYDRLPYFFTDQYDLGMEYTGYTEPDGYDQVVIRGDLHDPRVHRVLAARRARRWPAMNVNIWDVTEPIRGADPSPARRSTPAGSPTSTSQ